MGKFEEFNKEVNEKEIRSQVEKAKKNSSANNVEVPEGTYKCNLDKLELGATKKDGRPMLMVQLRILEGEFKKHCVFMNRVVVGTKNDMSMIASVEGWVNKLEPDKLLEFNGNYDDFAEDIMDAAEELCNNIIVVIDYNPDKFNKCSIVDVYDK